MPVITNVFSGSKEGLDWNIRYNIAVGIAEGLLYLHEGCHRRIIHRDIKASNILLTGDYQPQVPGISFPSWFIVLKFCCSLVNSGFN